MSHDPIFATKSFCCCDTMKILGNLCAKHSPLGPNYPSINNFVFRLSPSSHLMVLSNHVFSLSPPYTFLRCLHQMKTPPPNSPLFKFLHPPYFSPRPLSKGPIFGRKVTTSIHVEPHWTRISLWCHLCPPLENPIESFFPRISRYLQCIETL